MARQQVDELARSFVAEDGPEEEHRTHTIKMRGEPSRLEQVAGHDLDVIGEVGRSRIAGWRSHRYISLDQPGDHMRSDLARRAGDEEHER